MCLRHTNNNHNNNNTKIKINEQSVKMETLAFAWQYVKNNVWTGDVHTVQ